MNGQLPWSVTKSILLTVERTNGYLDAIGARHPVHSSPQIARAAEIEVTLRVLASKVT